MSETVKRYELRDVSTNPYSEFHQLRLDADGEWVEYADYAALAQQLADVAYLEEWNGGEFGKHILQCADGRWMAGWYPTACAGPEVFADADSLPALGARLRALSEEGGR